MSKIAKKPILIPNDIQININNKNIKITGKNKKLKYKFNKNVKIEKIKNTLFFYPLKNKKSEWKQAGTTRSIVNSMIIGITKGFSKKLKIFGVGYKVKLNNNKLILYLGFSHTIIYNLPKNLNVICKNQNEIILNSANKQLIGQTAAIIRLFHKPDSYKGKGIRYYNEIIKLKETKKK